jgi:hypothetical protein
MAALALQRCLHHAGREAIARCPECGHFYCRECIAEHSDRVICAACLRKLTAPAAAPPRRRRNLWPALQFCTGLLLLLVCFYAVGRMLLALPEEFHDDQLWRERVLQLSDPAEEEDE